MENYGSGAAGGYAFTKPFNISGFHNNAMTTGMSYIGSDGYLYTGGWYWGETTFYKQTNAGTNIVDYEANQSHGIIVNSTGEVKIASAAASSRTWSTVSVGGSATGSSNKAVAVSTNASKFVLMEDGRLYVSDAGATSMTSLVFSASTSTANGGIVDIAMGNVYQYVLFGNGDLYGSEDGLTSMSRIAQNVKMFDHDGYGYIYIYDGSMIKVASNNGASTHSWNNLLPSNRSDVVQIRGGYNTRYSQGGGWGFLTSSGTLYTNDTATGTSMTNRGSGISYFDCSAEGTFGYLKNGQIYTWVSSSSNRYDITTNTSPGALSGASGLPTPDLGGLPSINSSPPAKHLHFSKKKLTIN